jgi:hypothetical protein
MLFCASGYNKKHNNKKSDDKEQEKYTILIQLLQAIVPSYDLVQILMI